ncbi:MAG: tetratricopeptide repeat protein [Flavobacteriales bacterium]
MISRFTFRLLCALILLPLFTGLCAQEDKHCYVFFEEGAADSTSYNYEWDLGDGTVERGLEVKHCYDKPGNYLIVLNVIDEVTGEVMKQQASYTLNVEGKSAVEYNNEGVLRDKEKKYEEAIEAYTKAIALRPGYAKAWFNRGLTKGKMKDYQGAIADHSRAIESDPGFAEPYHYRGVMEFYAGEREKACRDLQKAAELGFEKSLKALEQFCK